MTWVPSTATFISFSSLFYDRSKASSKASSPPSAIQSFLFQSSLPFRNKADICYCSFGNEAMCSLDVHESVHRDTIMKITNKVQLYIYIARF